MKRIAESELIINPRGAIYHLDLKPDELARHVITVGDPARVKEVREVDQAKGLRLAASNREAWLEVSEETLYEHQTNLEVRLAETKQFIHTLEARLGNESYTSKAPAHLVEESREQLEVKKALLQRLETELDVLK